MTDLPSRLLEGLAQTEGLALAVSGGGDSMAMLHLAVAAGLRPLVVTVDHGLRPEAAAEAARVAEVSAGLGLHHHTLRWQGWDRKGNLQDAARTARRRLMADWARATGATSIALAHTEDDVAETFLMRLARGAGVDGLAAMSPVWAEGGVLWQRPLLQVGRAALRDWLRAQGRDWVEDPSNDNLRFDRVRVRQAAGPLAALGLSAPCLAGVARHLAEARQALEALARDWALRCLREEAGTVAIAPTLFDAPLETQRRLVQHVILWIAPAAYAPRGSQIGGLLASLAAGRPATLGGCRFLVGRQGLRACREARAAGPRVGPGQVWDGRWRITGDFPGTEVGALGAEGLAQVPDWRTHGLPRAALLAAPALWQGDCLIAAPFVGFGPSSCSATSLHPLLGHNSVALSH